MKNTRPRSKEFKEMLANEYLNSNISIKDLSDKYHTDAAYQLKSIGISLKGRGVQKMITRKECIKYTWDAASVTTEEQAYTLGFFMADGYNTGKQAGLTVKSSDSCILDRIKGCFSSEIKTQTWKDSNSFVISSIVICNNLRNLGIIEKKSRNEKSIPSIPEELLRHFIRGYFDGDGTVFVCKTHKRNFILKCNICSSTLNVLEEIQGVLQNNGIDCSIDKENRIGKKYHINQNSVSVATMDMFRLFIRRKNAIEKFFHYMYDEATIYLPRKYDVFANNKSLFRYSRHVNTELTEQIAKGCSAV